MKGPFPESYAVNFPDTWESARQRPVGGHCVREAISLAFHHFAAPTLGPLLRSGKVDHLGLSTKLAWAHGRHTATDARSELGARFDEQRPIFKDTMLLLSTKLAWAHDWTTGQSLTATFQALPGASFAIAGAPTPANSAIVSAAAELRFSGSVSLLGRFDGEFADGSRIYSGGGTLRYTW
jgi:Autotransporter beta-domain